MIGLSLIAFVVLSVAVIYGATALRDQQLYSQAQQERQGLYEEQLSTQLQVRSVALSGTSLRVVVSDNGSTTLYQYSHFSVVLQYYGNVSGVPVMSIAYYSYVRGEASPYQWNATSILEPDGVTTITLELPYPPYPGEPAVLTVDSNYGPGAVWRGTL